MPHRSTPLKRAGIESEQLVQREIVRAVMERRLKPGTKLDEETLADVFHISRTRLRKVLSQLSAQLIVTHKPNYGSFIAMPTVAEARDVFDARRGIEDAVLRIIGKKVVPPDFAPLRRYVTEEGRAYELKKAGAIELSGDFHLILADLAANSVLKTYMQQIVTRTILVQVRYSPGHVCLVHEHVQLLQALERGEIDEARESMQRHLDSIQQSCDLHEVDEEVVDLRGIFGGASGANTRPA